MVRLRILPAGFEETPDGGLRYVVQLLFRRAAWELAGSARILMSGAVEPRHANTRCRPGCQPSLAAPSPGRTPGGSRPRPARRRTAAGDGRRRPTPGTAGNPAYVGTSASPKTEALASGERSERTVGSAGDWREALKMPRKCVLGRSLGGVFVCGAAATAKFLHIPQSTHTKKTTQVLKTFYSSLSFAAYQAVECFGR